jgi:hypothetical protein
MCLVDKGPVNKDRKKRADIKAIFHADKNWEKIRIVTCYAYE